MQQKNYNVIGVMSGTSLDGIDLAWMQIATYPTYTATIRQATTVAYTTDWVKILKEAVHFSKEKLQDLNREYTIYLASVINNFIINYQIQSETIDAICSHGHTILHQPDQGYTLQIGNLPEIAQLTGQKVVCDFRVQDVQLGGQGAPLVPIGDQLLYKAYDYCLNLGGFANISMDINNVRIAYDICAVNTVLNVYANKLGKAYDEGGAFAKAGKLYKPLLDDLNTLPFFEQLPPKSLGIEWVHQTLFPLLEKYKLSPKDILRTFTEHIAIQLAKQFEENKKVLITGGGAFNEFLIERLEHHKKIWVETPSRELIEFKEAIVFGLLGVLKLENKINTLSSVTGAKHDHSSGVVWQP